MQKIKIISCCLLSLCLISCAYNAYNNAHKFNIVNESMATLICPTQYNCTEYREIIIPLSVDFNDTVGLGPYGKLFPYAKKKLTQDDFEDFSELVRRSVETAKKIKFRLVIIGNKQKQHFVYIIHSNGGGYFDNLIYNDVRRDQQYIGDNLDNIHYTFQMNSPICSSTTWAQRFPLGTQEGGCVKLEAKPQDISFRVELKGNTYSIYDSQTGLLLSKLNPLTITIKPDADAEKQFVDGVLNARAEERKAKIRFEQNMKKMLPSCLNWRQILDQQRYRITISREEFKNIQSKFMNNDCPSYIGAYQRRLAEAEQARVRALGW